MRLVTVDGRAFTLDPSLDELEPLLDPADFFRVNRQVIAHVQSIAKVHRETRVARSLSQTFAKSM